jgi:D-glycero-D-manno-heptose 1,7-bisphosphate phosphatase
MKKKPNHRKAVFLDRDGVINLKVPGYIKDIEEFRFLPGVIDALSILKNLGYALVIITNQRGIAKGLMTNRDLSMIHLHMTRELAEHDICLDGIYFCPHEDYEECFCRKPEPGMLIQASRDLCLDLGESYMVGDSLSDVRAGRNAGVRTVHITNDPDPEADLWFKDLPAFAEFLKDSESENKSGNIHAD